MSSSFYTAANIGNISESCKNLANYLSNRTSFEGVCLICRLWGAVVAISWRNKGGNVCNERIFVITLPSTSENRLHLSIERALCIRFALSLHQN